MAPKTCEVAVRVQSRERSIVHCQMCFKLRIIFSLTYDVLIPLLCLQKRVGTIEGLWLVIRDCQIDCLAFRSCDADVPGFFPFHFP